MIWYSASAKNGGPGDGRGAEMLAAWWTKKLRVDARPAPYTAESQAAFFLENLWSARRIEDAHRAGVQRAGRLSADEA